MSFTFHRHSIAFFVCALPLAATAQTSLSHSVPQLDNIVITPARSAQRMHDVVGDVTVISKEELQRAGQTSVAKILAKQPGIQFQNNGGPQTQTSLHVRGTNSTHTLVLIDGVRINSSVQGAINWNTIDPATIDRIEIVRGAASSLYGSDAIGGVINIITRQPGQDRPLSAWANVGYGTYNTTKSSAGLSGAAKGWGYSFSAATASSDGFDATRPGFWGRVPQRDNDQDGYRQHSVSGSLGYQFNPDHSLKLTLYNSYINADYDPGTATTRQQAYTITSTNQIADNWASTVNLSLSKEEYDDRAWHTRYSSIQRNYSWKNDFRLSDQHGLSVILERQEERIAHSDGYLASRRDTNSFVGIYRGDVGRHHIQASLRNDTITGYKRQTTGGLTYEYDVTERWSAGFSANTGFRMPTFTDLFSPAFPGNPGSDPWNYPHFHSNPDLKPEKSRNVELNVRYDTDDTQLALTLYQNKIRDLIAPSVCFQYDPAGFCQTTHPQNIHKATIRGLSLTGSQSLGGTTVYGSIDLMNPRDDNTRNILPRRARQVYNLGVNHRLSAWDLGAEYQFVGKRYDDQANNDRLGGYGLVNLTAAYDFSRNVGVQVRWNNIFDKDYTTVYGYNTPGSNIFVNLSFRM